MSEMERVHKFPEEPGRYGFIVECGGDAKLTPEQRDLLKQSWLEKESGHIIRSGRLREKARKIGGIRAVKYKKDGNIWVEMKEP